jgi:hypothetical protein
MMIPRASKLLALALAVASTGVSVTAEAQAFAQRWDPDWQPPRTAWGHPDRLGNWSNVTLTPFERGRGVGPVYTWAQVDSIEGREQSRVQRGFVSSDPNRARLQPGNVGGYNEVYFDRGDGVAMVDGEPRTSLITFPANGRMPALSPEGLDRKKEYDAFRSQFAEYDHPELRPLAERCIIYYGSSRTGVLGSPMTPTRAYNNNLTIVQNADHVLIRSEMIHDIRIIRLGPRQALPNYRRLWFGDAWGHWEGNTLVVETSNQHLDQGINVSGSMIRHSEDLRVIERFTKVDDDTILYEFEIDDPRTYSEPWGGQIPWERFDEQILEYACHEGNYALSNILSGARYQERQAGRNPPHQR